MKKLMLSHDALTGIFFSIQRALLDRVTPNLRAVYIFIENENVFRLSFYYDKNLSEEEEELQSLVETEFISDFPSPEYRKYFKSMIVPFPQHIHPQGFCAYKRYEKNRIASSKKLGDIRYSIQKALLDRVTPNLRGVYLFIESEQSCELLFFYDKKLSEDEQELSIQTYKEFSSDFSPPHQTTLIVNVVPYPEKIPGKGFCVYHRFE